MHILWASDSPLYPSAYGIQTSLLTPRLAKLGHQITIFDRSHIGLPITVNGIKVVGSIDAPGYNPASLLAVHAKRINADIVLTVKDPYVYDPNVMKGLPIPWVATVPVDTEPLSDANKQALNYASAAIAVSRSGASALFLAGIDPIYIPHAFDCKVFDIRDQAEERKMHGLPEDVFVAVFVGDNRTYPSRKNIENIIAAWAIFLKDHPDAVLILHTLLTQDRGGLDIQALLAAHQIPAMNVFISDQYHYAFGFPARYMSSLYNCSDVLLLPSTGEGFGLPIIESQLSGCPVLVPDWTAMRELVFFGIKIPTSDDVTKPIPTGQLESSPFGGFRYRVNATTIAQHLEIAYKNRPTKTDKEIGRRHALRFEVDYVVDRYWKPALIQLEKMLVTGEADGLTE